MFGTDWYAPIDAMLTRYARPAAPLRASTNRCDSSTSDVMLSWTSSASRAHSVVGERAEVAEAGVVDQDVDRRRLAVAAAHTRAAPPGVPRSPVDDVDATPAARRRDLASASSRRAVSTRSQPRAASSRAIAAPMPLDAPVTSARNPVSSAMRAKLARGAPVMLRRFPAVTRRALQNAWRRGGFVHGRAKPHHCRTTRPHTNSTALTRARTRLSNLTIRFGGRGVTIIVYYRRNHLHELPTRTMVAQA